MKYIKLLFFVYRMDRHSSNEFVVRIPILLEGVTECEGFSRASWHMKPIILWNKAGNNVAWRVCQSVNAELIIDMDGKPLDDDHVVILIA